MAYESSVPYRAGTEGNTGPGPARPSARAPIPPRTARDVAPARGSAPTVPGLPAPCSGLPHPEHGSAGPLHATGGFSAYSTITFRRIPVEEPT
ncbi:hypothetical protein [Streptomyces sp. NPDC054786]